MRLQNKLANAHDCSAKKLLALARPHCFNAFQLGSIGG
jgi:hypothetical protein